MTRAAPPLMRTVKAAVTAKVRVNGSPAADVPNDVREHDLRGRRNDAKRTMRPTRAEAAYKDAPASSKKCRTTKTSTFVRMASERREQPNPHVRRPLRPQSGGTAPTGVSVRRPRDVRRGDASTITTPMRPDKRRCSHTPGYAKAESHQPDSDHPRAMHRPPDSTPRARETRAEPVSSALVNGTTKPMATAQAQPNDRGSVVESQSVASMAPLVDGNDDPRDRGQRPQLGRSTRRRDRQGGRAASCNHGEARAARADGQQAVGTAPKARRTAPARRKDPRYSPGIQQARHGPLKPKGRQAGDEG